MVDRRNRNNQMMMMDAEIA